VPFSWYETNKKSNNCFGVFLIVEMVDGKVYGMITPECYFELIVTAEKKFIIIFILHVENIGYFFLYVNIDDL
jgi:hypothetical protein